MVCKTDRRRIQGGELRVFAGGLHKTSGGWALTTPVKFDDIGTLMIVLDADHSYPETPALYVLTSTGLIGWVWYEDMKVVK